MKSYHEFTIVEQQNASVKANNWAHQHSEHVNKLLATVTSGYEPSGSDCFRPELWKAAHWYWFHTVRSQEFS